MAAAAADGVRSLTGRREKDGADSTLRSPRMAAVSVAGQLQLSRRSFALLGMPMDGTADNLPANLRPSGGTVGVGHRVHAGVVARLLSDSADPPASLQIKAAVDGRRRGYLAHSALADTPYLAEHRGAPVFLFPRASGAVKHHLVRSDGAPFAVQQVVPGFLRAPRWFRPPKECGRRRNRQQENNRAPVTRPITIFPDGGSLQRGWCSFTRWSLRKAVVT